MGYDILLDDQLGLQLFRDGKSPAAQGGSFGQAVATAPTGDKDQYVVYDRLVGGMGGTDRLIPHSYALGIDVCTRFGRVWTPGGEKTDVAPFPLGFGGAPPGPIRSMKVIGNSLLIGAGSVLYRLDEPYTSAVVEQTLDPGDEITQIVVYQNFICLGTQLKADHSTPSALYVKHPTLGWTRSGSVPGHPTLPMAKRKYLCQAYFRVDGGQGVVGEWRLDGTDTNFSHKWIATTDPLNLLDDSAWSSNPSLGAGAGYAVGDATNPITSIVAGGVHVIFHAKTDGVYQMQPDGRSARIVDWSNSLHPNNGKQAIFAHGAIWASHGRQGMVKVDVANQQIQWTDQACAPGSGLPRISPISGFMTALGLDGEWLVGNVWNGRDSFICYGRPTQIEQQLAMETIQAPQPLTWHGSEATFWSEQVTAVFQASIGSANRPLLWVAALAADGVTPLLHNVSLPATGSPLEDWIHKGPHRFTTDCWLYLPREDLGANEQAGWANAQKIYTRLETNVEHLERYVTYLEVYSSTAMGHQIFWDLATDPGTTDWTFIGRLEDSVRASMVPPISVQSGPQDTIMLRGHSTADHPFAFNSLKLRAMPLSEQAERRRFRCLLAGNVRKRNQTMDRRDQYSLLNQMMGYMEADPVSLLTRHNVRFVGKVEEGLSWQEVTDPQTKEPSVMVDFTFKILRRSFYYGQGQRWGSAITWSGPKENVSP